jgi:Ca2+-binding EF-hand superfamily protein
VFRHFDVDDSGYISADNLAQIFQRAGKELTTQEIEQLIKEVDLTEDGLVSFQEFKAMFHK